MKILKRGIISRNPDTFFAHCGWPTVCKDEDGVLYAVASGCRAAHICPFGKTLLWKSTDEGNTWSLPMIVNDTWLDDRDAGIVSLGGKRLLVSWFEHSTDLYQNILREHILKDHWAGCESVLDMYSTLPEDKRNGGSYIRVSENGGFSWGETVKVPVSCPHGPVLLKDGTLFYVGKQMYADGTMIPDGDYENCFIQAWVGSPDGKTWTYRGRIDIPEGLTPQNFTELHSIELKDGRIMAVIRAEGIEVSRDPDAYQSCYTMYKTFTSDGGRSWTPAERLPVNGAPPHLLRHSSGAIILSYGRRLGPCGQRAIVSYDEGETWSEEYIIDEIPPFNGFYRNDLGYPASVELSDGSILTVYYQSYNNDPAPSILYTRWTL
ncbi:MAG: exo-alpha-sialidase [Oscillospiraceae bacterium]|nr:exo-alpha-sialidase [Oscillospiraceae bacterium]